MHVQTTLSLPWHGAAREVQPALLMQPWIGHQVPIAAGFTGAVWIQSFAHMTGAAGIEPHTSECWVQRLTNCV